MANELQLNISITGRKGYFSFLFNPGTLNMNLAADPAFRGGHAQAIGTAAGGEALDYGDVSTFGLAVFRNLDPTNYIEYGPTSGGVLIPWGRLQPGQIGLTPLVPGITPRARANSAEAILDCHFLEL